MTPAVRARLLGCAAAGVAAVATLAACGSPEPGRSPPPAAGRAPGPTSTAPTGGTARPSAGPTAPAGPYVAAVPLPRGCLVLGPGLAGVKVYLVQRSLGLAGLREVYDADTAAAVLHFQSAHGLPATARVDAATWRALGTGSSFCVDRFTRQPAIGPTSSPSAHASAALAFARSQVGTRYIWGGAGPLGYDCSGLALQSLYGGGRVVPGVTTDEHVRSAFNTAAAIYRSPAFGHVALSGRRPGDLVFWGSDFHHMALYLGNDRIVEAVRPVVRIASLWSHGTPLPVVARPFPG